MNQYIQIGSIVGGVVVLLLGVLIQYAAFPAYLRNEIIKAKQLLNGSEALERWVTLPIPLEYKIFVFNVTNPKEISQGALPIVKEVGPYFYDEYIHKENLRYSEDTISYSVRKIYRFNQKKSGCRREEDIITGLNVALLGTAMMVEQIFKPGLLFLNNAIPYLFPEIKNVFWSVTIKDLFFDGIVVNCSNIQTSTICNGMQGQTPETLQRLPSGDYSFAFFRHKNNTLRGPIVENRGIRNISNLGRILSFKGKNILEEWEPNSTCSMLRGTDSSIYPPFISRKEPIYIFEPDVCASLAATYEEDIHANGMEVLRFVNSPENFGDPAEYEASKCRCKLEESGKEICQKPGVMDLTECQGVPVIASLPHFYLADSSYKSYVEGLTPNKEDHLTYIDIEPETGVPIEGHKRLQLNLHLRKIHGISLLNNVSEGLFPLLWLDEGVELNSESLEKLHSFYSSISMVKWFSIFIIILGCIITIVSGIYFMYVKKILCFKSFSSNKIRTVLNLTTLEQNKETEEANRTSLYKSSHTTVPHNELNLKFLSNNYPNIFPCDAQVTSRPSNINLPNTDVS